MYGLLGNLVPRAFPFFVGAVEEGKSPGNELGYWAIYLRWLFRWLHLDLLHPADEFQ